MNWDFENCLLLIIDYPLFYCSMNLLLFFYEFCMFNGCLTLLYWFVTAALQVQAGHRVFWRIEILKIVYYWLLIFLLFIIAWICFFFFMNFAWFNGCLTLLYWFVTAALHMAAANGHLDIVEYLINQGVVRVHACFPFQVLGDLGFWVEECWWLLWKGDTAGIKENRSQRTRKIQF